MATSGGITTLLCSLIVAALTPTPVEGASDETFVVNLEPCHRVIRLDPDARDTERTRDGLHGDPKQHKSHC
ncbi:MAG: hypothetical protein ACRDLB_08805 [Actinomycetota bacterium]